MLANTPWLTPFAGMKFTGVMSVFLCLFNPTETLAASYLSIPGSFSPPGIIGPYPDMSEFSWIKHRFPSNTTYFSWNFGGGTDGGILLGKAQAYTELTDTFIMFNQPTGFFSVNGGISIDNTFVIDMSNLRMYQSGRITDIGSGSGYSTLVPLVSDISTLGDRENGWTVDSSGTYRLVYNTRGTCPDCEMTILLYGSTNAALPSGDLNFDGKVDALDVLLGLRIISGDISATDEELAQFDVAPLVNGAPVPNGATNAGDILVIERKALGLANF